MPATRRIRDSVLAVSLRLAAVLMAIAFLPRGTGQVGSDRYSSIVIDAATG